MHSLKTIAEVSPHILLHLGQRYCNFFSLDILKVEAFKKRSAIESFFFLNKLFDNLKMWMSKIKWKATPKWKKKSNKKDIEAKILIAKLVMLKFRIHYRNESNSEFIIEMRAMISPCNVSQFA